MSTVEHERYADAVRQHYSQDGLVEEILIALELAGLDTEALSPVDLASFDEFHIGGRESTVELGRLADLALGERVLDMGCGIGGPARTLAMEFGCVVDGIDIVPEYTAAARMLTERVGLSDTVSIRVGDSCNLPYDDNVFDVVWSQHTLVNCPNKPRLLSEAWRVLAPGGRVALYEVCAGEGGPPVFPLPWASDESISHLTTSTELRHLLALQGFEEQRCRDVTQKSKEWFGQARDRAKAGSGGDRPRPTLRLLMGPDAALKSKNLVRNLEQRRIEVAMYIWKRPA